MNRVPRTSRCAVLLGSMCLLVACQQGEPEETGGDGSAAVSGISHARLVEADLTPGDWLTHGRTFSEQRFSPLNQINADNVAELGLVWSYDTGRTRGHETTPLYADGVLYVTTPWSGLHALDARTGEALFLHDADVPGAWGRYACCDVVNRGAALYGEHVFLGTLDGRLTKLDRKTGEVVWDVNTIDRERPYTITGAPRVVKGQVIIGNGGAEYGVRGYVSAYDAETGEMTWRFYTVPGDPSLGFENEAMEKAAATWSGEWWEVGGGGTAWDSIAYDPELDLLYVGTGNGTPWSRAARGPEVGDNLYISSILALDPDDGSLVWYYQTTPGDNWDYTATQHIMLADLTLEGRERKVLIQAPKNGFFYVLDRATGELLSAEKFSKVTWASHVDLSTGRPVETPEGHYDDEPKLIYPSPGGAHNWHPMAFSPDTGLVYIPKRVRGSIYALQKDFEYTPGTWNTGTGLTPEERATLEPPPPTEAYLLAWDPVAGKERWRVANPSRSNGGLLATAGNLVFQGTADGVFAAFRADTGEKLWSTELGIAVIAPPITWQMDGEQYVTIVAGWGGIGTGAQTIAKTHKNVGRVFTFKLGGAAVIPEVPTKRELAGPLPERFGTAREIARGNKLYGELCAMCHGAEAISGGLFSDLRYSRKAVHDNFSQIVLDGRFESRGMASFADILSEEDTRAIHAYVVMRAQTRDVDTGD